MIVGGDIVDKKAYDDTDRVSYAGMPNGALLQRPKQEMRIKFVYPGGFVDYAYLPYKNFTFSKSGTSSYKIH